MCWCRLVGFPALVWRVFQVIFFVFCLHALGVSARNATVIGGLAGVLRWVIGRVHEGFAEPSEPARRVAVREEFYD